MTADHCVRNHGTAICLMVPGNPIPKARPRVIHTRSGRTITYTPRTTIAWENTIADVAQVFCKPIGGPFDGPLALTLRFVRTNHVRADLDNLAKAILDALNGIAYQDDAQIRELHLYLEAPDADNPRVDITIRQLEEE